ncbi:gliding motility-associated C-terminal domain-containing protein, partial [Belliella sp. DSM 111904]
TLAPGAEASIDTDYTVTQADVDAGSVLNKALVSTESPDGENPGDEDEIETEIDQESGITIEKTADKSVVSAAGEEVVYTLTVTNTGNTTLSNVVIADAMLGVTETVETLAPNATASFDYTYTVTQSDIDNGSILNVATVSTESPDGENPGDEDEVEVDVDQESGITIEKVADKSVVSAAGEEIVYTLTVTNTGNTTLINVVIADAMLGATETVETLAPNATASFDYTYTVTQSDIDNGSILNVATVSTESPDGENPGDEDEVEVDVDQESGITLEKTADKSVVSAAGEEVVYTLTVTNTGNTTLSNVVIADAMLGVTETVETLAPNATASFDYTYTVTQSDIDNGSILNVATVSTESPDGENPGDEDEVEVDVDQESGITIEKVADKSVVSAAGEEVVYTLTVTNTGNTTLSNVVIADAMLGVTETVETLAPNATASFDYTYTVTQSDIDNGSILNVATVSTESPDGENPGDEDEVEVDVDQESGITLEKTADKSVVSAAGEEVVYTLTVTNTGNTTLSNVVIADAMLSVTETVETLAPNATASFDYTYTVTQSDIDNGSILNVATVSTESPDGENPGDEDEVEVEVVDQSASIQIVKTADTSVIQEVGEVINYTLTVTNTGAVTLTEVVVIDPLTGFEQGIDSLSPGQVVVLTTSYTVTAEDIENGSVVNTANATATTPEGNPISDEDSLTIGVEARPILAIDDELGEFVVSFGGMIGNILDNDLLDGQSVTMDNVDFVFTDLDGIVGLLINPNGELSLIPGVNEARDYRLRYELSEVMNPSNMDEAFVTFRILNDEVDVSVSKTSFGVTIYEGDEFEYEIQVLNQGVTDAENVVITDDLPNGVSYLSSSFQASDVSIQPSTTTNGQRVTWTVPNFPAGASLTIRVQVRANELPSSNPITITNVVTVVSDGEEVSPENNTDTDVNMVNPFFIPNVITPDGDNRNDSFEIKGLGKFATNEIVIFNRYGDHVFERSDYQNDWRADGLPAGTYFYVLRGTDNAGRLHEFKGWIQVIKD